MKQILTILLIITFPFISNAQKFEYRVMRFTKASPSDELRCIFFDHTGMMWIGTNSGLKSFDGYKINTYRSDVSSPEIFPNNYVMSMTEDHNNCLWIGTHNGIVKMDRRNNTFKSYFLPYKIQRIIYTLYTSRDGTIWAGTDGGLNYYDKKKDRFVNFNNTFVQEPNGKRHRIQSSYSVKSIIEDNYGNMYVGTWNAGLFRFCIGSHVLYRYPLINGGNKAYSLYIDRKNRLWIGTWGRGILMMNNPLNFNNPRTRSYNNRNEVFSTYYKIIEDPISNTIWACSREGISIIDLYNEKGGFKNFTNTGYPNPKSLEFNADMITDGKGNIWLETVYDGIIQINTRPSIFRVWNVNTGNLPLKINSVCSIFTQDGKYIWLGLKPFGLALYNRKTGSELFGNKIKGLSNIKKDMLNSTFSSIVKRYNGDIWFANNSYGIMVIRKGGGAYAYDSKNSTFITDNYVNSLYQAKDNTMWIGQRSGICIAYPNNSGIMLKMIERNKVLSNCEVRAISGDHKGNIWVATENEGIIRISGNPYRPQTLVYHQYCPPNKNYAVDDATTCFEDSHHRLWAISHSGGLFRYSYSKDKFIAVNSIYHIDGDKVLAINEDAFGTLWLTSEKSFIRLSFNGKNTPDVTSFGEEDGLGSMLFQPNATFRYHNELFFGNSKSFFSFFPPKALKDYNNLKKNLIITNLILDDKNYSSLDSSLIRMVSEVSPAFTKNITIPSGIEKFSIEFALLSYSNPEHNKYAYKLEGYDKDWKYRDASLRRATFENLPSGIYKLHLKAADSFGEWHEMPYTVTIKVLPPFYATWWAMILYFLVIIGMIYFSLKWYQNYLKTKNRLQMAVIFTNITHELLTPLTVISASVDYLREESPSFTKNYDMIQENIHKLTKLLRQILEIRKSQAGELKLLVSKKDLCEFVRIECNNMMPLLKKKRLSLEIKCSQNKIYAWFDSDKLDKIIYNLLSNAVKYTQEDGKINISVTTDGIYATLTIADNGIGITKEKMKMLYHRFFDGDYRKMRTEGTGIGLSLTHDLITLHHGKIDCQSEVNKGTIFTVKIPISKNYYKESEIDTSNNAKAIDKDTKTINKVNSIEIDKEEKPVNDEDFYRILIVEDNEELLEIMGNLLHRKYKVFKAKNGKQAYNIICKEELDIVISDVMMPIMDGIELTQKIKDSDDYAQLPVIMLTARTLDEDRNEAYSIGADEYITKPFKLEDLQLRIDNIIANRERIRKKFCKQTYFKVSDQHYSSPDEIFIQKAVVCIQNHIKDADYDRGTFASDMCMSSSSLYNKIRALTGQNVTGFINSIRLKEACRIVRENPYMQVTELSMLVGFNTPKYFSKCFKKEFGILPKDFIEKEYSKS